MTESLAEHVLTILAGDLQSALTAVVPNTRGKVRKGAVIPVNLAFDNKKGSGELQVSEARHGAREHVLTARGNWSDTCQVAGKVLWKLIEKYPPDADLELALTQSDLAIRHGGSRMMIPRLDRPGRKKVSKRKLKPDPRHTGPVVMPPDWTQKRVAWGDTWAFSARVPMPEHRLPKKT